MAPRDPFVRRQGGMPQSGTSRAAPQEEGLHKDGDLTYGAGSRNHAGSGAPGPFVRDAGGGARSQSGGFAGGDESADVPDPFLRNADGSPRSASGRSATDHPRYDRAGDAFVYGDGTRVRGSDPSGRGGKVNEKGDIVYGDGTIVTHDRETGATTVVRPDGSTETRAGRAPRYDKASDSFVYGNGVRVRGSDRKGRSGKANPDGSIDYADGTRVSRDPATGRTEIHRPDGSATVHDEHGGVLRTGPGTMTSRSEDGGTNVHDRESGVTAHFGPRDSGYVEGDSKDGDSGDDPSGSSSEGGSGSSDAFGSGESGSDSSGSGDSDDDASDSDSGDSNSADSDGSDADDGAPRATRGGAERRAS